MTFFLDDVLSILKVLRFPKCTLEHERGMWGIVCAGRCTGGVGKQRWVPGCMSDCVCGIEGDSMACAFSFLSWKTALGARLVMSQMAARTRGWGAGHWGQRTLMSCALTNRNARRNSSDRWDGAVDGLYSTKNHLKANCAEKQSAHKCNTNTNKFIAFPVVLAVFPVRINAKFARGGSGKWGKWQMEKRTANGERKTERDCITKWDAWMERPESVQASYYLLKWYTADIWPGHPHLTNRIY